MSACSSIGSPDPLLFAGRGAGTRGDSEEAAAAERGARAEGEACMKRPSRAKNDAAGIIGRRKGKPVDERAHFYVCEECGQAIDKRHLGSVFHHEQPEHERLPDDA